MIQDRKIKILWVSDGVTPTGFSRVAHNVISRLPDTEYEIKHLAINYFGDPHPYKHLIYPAVIRGDVWGVKRLGEFVDWGPDIIFLFNDPWLIKQYMDALTDLYKDKQLPKIVVYFPVDAEWQEPEWFEKFDKVSKVCVYTEFAKKAVQDAISGLPIEVVPHGNDSSVFFRVPIDKKEIKKDIFGKREDLQTDETFIVLNANRNQPRKKLDIAIRGFAMFAEGKPANVMYYHHAGLKDVGVDVIRLVNRLGMATRFIITNNATGVQVIPESRLNLIYNACDVGINTSMGEGWGLCNVEHAVTGALQLVPDSSATGEIFKDCGVLLPTVTDWVYENTQTKGRLTTPEMVAAKLQWVYNNKPLADELVEKAVAKFTSYEYSWEFVAANFDRIFKSVL